LKASVGAVLAGVLIVGAAVVPSANAASDDACSLLTQAQVSAAVSISVGAGVACDSNVQEDLHWNATNVVAQAAKFVTLMLQGLDAFQAGKAALVKTIVVTPVSGIGDDAYYLAVGTNVGLIVKKGNVAFKIAVYGDIPIEKKESLEKTLAQQVVSQL
jgi:hypothetical protein